MIYLLLDILIYNFTNYSSYFFLININFQDLLTNLIIGLIIDLFIMHTFFINTLIILILYFLKKYFWKINLNNFLYYCVYNLFNLLFYYLVMNIIFKEGNLVNLLSVLVINLIFIVISYKNKDFNISFIG